MDRNLADVHLRVWKILRHDLLDIELFEFINEMHQKPCKHLPVAEDHLDERVTARVVLPRKHVLPQCAKLMFRVFFHSRSSCRFHPSAH